MSGSHTAGSITLSGFTSDTTSSPFAAINDSNLGNNYVFNWSGPDFAGNGAGQVVSASGTGAWSLTVRLLDYPGHMNFGSEQLLSGVIVLTDFGNTAGYTAHGTDAAGLQAFIQSLNVNFSNGSGVQSDAYRVNFSLDVGGSVATWDTYFLSTAIPCFVPGTRLAAPRGERRVEDLRIGDRVLTASGAARPVKWIGRRAYTAAQMQANPHLRPVLIRRDAIAPGQPRRELRVSPMHAIVIDGALVPAAALVNGVSILRDGRPGPLAYLHVELASHDTILAEGLATESYLDDDSRQMFDNADAYIGLYGAVRPPAAFLLPRLEEGVRVEAIRRRIAARVVLEFENNDRPVGHQHHVDALLRPQQVVLEQHAPSRRRYRQRRPQDAPLRLPGMALRQFGPAMPAGLGEG